MNIVTTNDGKEGEIVKKGWLITGIILCALSVLDLLGRLVFDFW